MDRRWMDEPTSGARIDPSETFGVRTDAREEWSANHENIAPMLEAEKMRFRMEGAKSGYAPGAHRASSSNMSLPPQDEPSANLMPKQELDSLIQNLAAPTFASKQMRPESDMPEKLLVPFFGTAPDRSHQGLQDSAPLLNTALENLPPKDMDTGFRHRRSAPRCSFGMTSRDIELVIRMHNKQLEFTRPLIDDYYLHEFNRKRNIPDEYVTNPHLDDSSQSWFDIQRRPMAGASHTAANSATLEKSLGTLQSWTPKAPRMIVDVAPMKSGALLFTVTDDRVAVRAIIECGYDVLATIDDYRRRVKIAPDGQLKVQSEAEKLFNLFGIVVNAEENPKKKQRSEKLFAQICAMTKGQRLISRGLKVFQPAHQALVIAAVLRHMGFLCDRSLFSEAEYRDSAAFWTSICAVLNQMRSLPTLLWILWSFLEAHEGSSADFVRSISSAHGGQVIYTLLSRGYAIIASPDAQQAEVDEWNMSFKRFFSLAIDQLPTIFRTSENVSKTWEIIAMLDALADDEDRDRFRSTITKLLRSGVAPQPR